MTKEEMKRREKELLQITGAYCIQELNEDYFQLCEKLIKKMGRKREVPFVRGKVEIWAAAVIQAIGSINFLSDRSFEPYATSADICDYFGVKTSTVSGKAKKIKDMFKLGYYSSEFSTQHMAQNNPFNDLVMVDGFIVPLSSIPEHLQEMVKEERRQGRDLEFTTRPA